MAKPRGGARNGAGRKAKRATVEGRDWLRRLAEDLRPVYEARIKELASLSAGNASLIGEFHRAFTNIFEAGHGRPPQALKITATRPLMQYVVAAPGTVPPMDGDE